MSSFMKLNAPHIVVLVCAGIFTSTCASLTSVADDTQNNVGSAVNCHNHYQCAYETVSNNGGGDIECFGYRSCFGDSLIETEEQGNIRCHGSNACADSQKVSQKASSLLTSYNIECLGLYSCANIEYRLQNVGGNILCFGEKSCYNATRIYDVSSEGNRLAQLREDVGAEDDGSENDDTGGAKILDDDIFNVSVSRNIYCDGDQACGNVSSDGIYIKDTLFASGHLSLYNSTVWSMTEDINHTTFIFTGAFSGYQANVFCSGEIPSDDNRCLIACYGNSCNNLTFESASANVEFICDESEQNNICPDGYQPMKPLPNLIELDIKYETTYDNSYSPCFTPITNALVCDDYLGENSNSGDDTCSELDYLDDENNPICCTAAFGCYSFYSLETNISFSNNNDNMRNKYINGTAIRCDGYQSCFGNNGPDIEATTGGNIYFSGFQSANGGSSTAFISTTDEYNIMCTGRESCTQNVQILSFDNLFCNGYDSCNGVTVSSGGGNVYSYGMYGSRFATISNIINLYCGGYASCLQTEIENVAGDIYGYNYASLNGSSITNVTGTLYAYGAYSIGNCEINLVSGIYGLGHYVLYSSQITNVFNIINATGYQALGGYSTITNDIDTFMSHNVETASIYCIEDQACRFVKLSGFTSLFVKGDNGLFESTIVTGGFTKLLASSSKSSSHNISISIDGNIDGLYNVYVNQSDSVTIDCKTSNACGNMWLHCSGNCYVNCDEKKGINCPIQQ